MRAYGLSSRTLTVLAAAVLGACTSTAMQGTSIVPSARNQHERSALQPKFLHEFQLPSGAYPGSIVKGADGAMWFGTYPYYTNHPPTHLGIGRITTRGSQKYFLFGKGVYNIAEGADGKVWFTNPYSKPYSYGSITTHGTVQQYDMPGSIGYSPESMVSDPHKHLWFTVPYGFFDIVEISTDGKIVASFKVQNGTANKVGYGATGRIWFDAIANPSQVGLITLRGGQHEGAIGGPNFIPGPMALGPDGRMWLCLGTDIAAVTRSLKVSLYSLPSNGNAADVTAGPDGNMWVTDSGNSAIVRVTTSGAITEYKTPTPSMIPDAIAVGPDRNIWFTEIQQQTDASKIGVLRP
jgi:streptogramin lyase